MLRQVAEGALVHRSEFLQSNAIVVQGRAGACCSSTQGCRTTKRPASRTLLLESVAGDVDVLVPGHGSVGGADQMRAAAALVADDRCTARRRANRMVR